MTKCSWHISYCHWFFSLLAFVFLACLTSAYHFVNCSPIVVLFCIFGFSLISLMSDMLIKFAFTPVYNFSVIIVPFICSVAIHLSSLTAFIWFSGTLLQSTKECITKISILHDIKSSTSLRSLFLIFLFPIPNTIWFRNIESMRVFKLHDCAFVFRSIKKLNFFWNGTHISHLSFFFLKNNEPQTCFVLHPNLNNHSLYKNVNFTDLQASYCKQ